MGELLGLQSDPVECELIEITVERGEIHYRRIRLQANGRYPRVTLATSAQLSVGEFRRNACLQCELDTLTEERGLLCDGEVFIVQNL